MIKTKDYNIFKKCPSNRPLDSFNLKKITQSIQCNNMLALRPIICNANMEIIDGQHRLEAAKTLGVEVYYIQKMDSLPHDIILLNNAQKSWSLEDFIKYHAEQGLAEYNFIINFAKKHDLSCKDVLILMAKNGGKSNDIIKRGSFKIDIQKIEPDLLVKLDQLKELINFIESKIVENPKFLRSICFKRALIVLFENPECEFDVFKHKIKVNLSKVRSCTTISQYVEMFTGIYNYKNNNPIQ